MVLQARRDRRVVRGHTQDTKSGEEGLGGWGMGEGRRGMGKGSWVLAA